jgi:hypothetical protein
MIQKRQLGMPDDKPTYLTPPPTSALFLSAAPSARLYIIFLGLK